MNEWRAMPCAPAGGTGRERGGDPNNKAMQQRWLAAAASASAACQGWGGRRTWGVMNETE